MRFGVNYIPSKDWLYSWLDFDEESIRRDILTIKSLGFDHIRAHTIWSYFQPNESVLSEHCMNNLKKFCRICRECDMDYFLSLFTGWMSGFVFFPSWLNVGGPDVWHLGMFSNERAMKAEKFYIREIAAVTASEKNFLGFDLGNELNVVANRDVDPQIDYDKCAAWSREMFRVCNEVAPEKMHSNGMAHAPWFGDTYFPRKALANDGDITPVHAWAPFTHTSRRYGFSGKETHRLPNYMIEMAKAYCDDPTRKYWVQEWGMADEWVKSEEELRIFITKTLENCVSDPSIWGITWWCSHDISHRFTGFCSIEYSLGVIDVSNQPKAAGLIFKEFIENYKEGKYPVIRPTKALVIQKGTGASEDYTNAEPYFNMLQKGEYVAFVTEENKNNREYLNARGITEVIG